MNFVTLSLVLVTETGTFHFDQTQKSCTLKQLPSANKWHTISRSSIIITVHNIVSCFIITGTSSIAVGLLLVSSLILGCYKMTGT